MIFTFMYGAITLFCIGIMLVVIFRLHLGKNRYLHSITLAASLVCFIIIFVVDVIWIGKERGLISMSNIAFFWVNLVYFVFNCLASYLWFLYVAQTCISNKKAFRILNTVLIVLLIATIIFIVTSRFNSLVFYIDDSGIYKRGDYYYVALIAGYIYIICGCLVALVTAFKKENFSNRSQHLSFFTFSLFAFLTSLLQVLFPEIPLLCISVALAYLWLFFDLQDLMITKDQQTGLQTRNYILHLIEQRIKHDDGTTYLYVYMIDIDGFKQINDYYGHIEGDRALVRLSSIFIDYGDDDRFSAAKIGGDEFLYVYQSKNKINPASIIKALRERLVQENKKANTPYKLTVSIGFSTYKTGDQTVDLIKRADMMMYKDKQKKKQYKK